MWSFLAPICKIWFISTSEHMRKLPKTWDKVVVFPLYSGFLNLYQMDRKELALLKSQVICCVFLALPRFKSGLRHVRKLPVTHGESWWFSPALNKFPKQLASTIIASSWQKSATKQSSENSKFHN